MMKENVPWMPGLYVSVDGDIFELRNNNWVQLRIYHSLSKNHKYRRAYFYFRGGIHPVSRLVAKVHIPNKYNKPYVGHKDNNPLNNRVSNLYWCTPKENTEKAVREGRMKPGYKRGDKNPYYRVFGDKHPKSKYSNELKIKIYKFYQKHPNWTIKQLQSKFKVKSHRPLHKIIRGEDPIIAEYLKEVE